MLFSRNWLAQYVELPADDDELARRLTFAGLAVEYVEAKGDDVVFDIDVTTNRPDCMNHLGVAREIAVLFDRPLTLPPHLAADPGLPGEAAGIATVAIEDERCPRYTAAIIRGVTVGPSPEWLRRRLEAVGSRSINNVVDVTNFVLWELGQPLHAFDLAKLAGPAIVVRAARQGEELVTLDGERRTLDPQVLVIADAERAVALGGIMGGLDSEVTDATIDILLESAHFDPRAVRRGARQLAMHTDASHRFERGADPEICARAAHRAAHLIAELAGGRVVEGTLDTRHDGQRSWRLAGRLELPRLERFMGTGISAEVVERWMSGLGFELSRDGGSAWTVRAPAWRYYDFERRRPDGEIYEADLFEEVVRLHGYDSIPSTTPNIPGSDGPQTAVQIARRRLQDHLVGCGFAEAINFAFHSCEQAARFPAIGSFAAPGGAEAVADVELANPLSELYSVLRRSLLPGLLESAGFNQRRNATAVALFELGNTFLPGDGALPWQIEAVSLIQGGAGSQGNAWEPRTEIDFFDLKGVVESLVAVLMPGATLSTRPAQLPGFLPGATAELWLRTGEHPVDEGPVGYLGQVDEDGPFPLFAAEVLLTPLAGGGRPGMVAVPSRFPSVEVDLTFTHALSVPWSELAAAVRELRPTDLREHHLKYRYRGQGVPEGAVNTTISFSYNADDRSLTHDEVNECHQVLAAELVRRFGFDREES